MIAIAAADPLTLSPAAVFLVGMVVGVLVVLAGVGLAKLDLAGGVDRRIMQDLEKRVGKPAGPASASIPPGAAGRACTVEVRENLSPAATPSSHRKRPPA